MMRCNYAVTVKAEGGGTDSICPAALLGALRRGNKPPVLLGEEK